MPNTKEATINETNFIPCGFFCDLFSFSQNPGWCLKYKRKHFDSCSSIDQICLQDKVMKPISLLNFPLPSGPNSYKVDKKVTCIPGRLVKMQCIGSILRTSDTATLDGKPICIQKEPRKGRWHWPGFMLKLS